MTVHIEALKLALEALEGLHRLHYGGLELHELNAIHKNHERGITAIKAALAAPVQEPVAWLVEFENGEQELDFGETHTPLYTTPPAAQRQWVGLTPDEFQFIYDNCLTPSNLIDMVEAKLKEKNA